jgi:excisionase family DNA binding protein
MSTVMTIEEVAEFLRVHPSTVYRLLKRHSIPAFKMGSDWRFNRESIEKWVVEQEVVSGCGDAQKEPRAKGLPNRLTPAATVRFRRERLPMAAGPEAVILALIAESIRS